MKKAANWKTNWALKHCADVHTRRDGTALLVELNGRSAEKESVTSAEGTFV